jgi:hypothetical protein
MSDVGSVITSQADLLWTLALAMLGFQIVLVRNWSNGHWRIRRWWSFLLLIGSMCAFAISMFLGYLTYGAVVELLLPDLPDSEAKAMYKTAGGQAFNQLVSFGIGLLLFVILFVVNPKAVSETRNGAR